MPDNIPNIAPVHFKNHIVIGLGGTGGKVLREFRKDLFRRHGTTTVPGVRMQFLYVDSSQDDIDNVSDWQVLGRSIQLPQSSRLNIGVPDLLAIVENASAYPGIAPWLGPRSLWLDYLGSVQGLKAAGGQRRRLGRLLFAHNVGLFNDAIAAQYNELVTGVNQGEAGNSGVTFHVVCGLAGGTGSGSVVDAVAQIGRFIATRGASLRDRILVYCYLPETNPPKSRVERYYFANGYAALVELNAMSVGRYLPHNVAGSRAFELGEFVPFNGCYVFTNQTEGGGTSYHPDDVPSLLAGYLYQKIGAVGDASSWSVMVRAENSENGLPDTEPRSGPNGPKPPAERSVRFLTFGIKRIAIPEGEILEFLTYSYAQEAVRQLRFNHWSPQFGFLDNVRNNDFSACRKEESLARFRCSWDHLILSRPVLEVDVKKNWLPIEEYWQAFLDHSVEDVVNEVDKKFWLTELRAMVTDQIEKEYRGDGLGTFYGQKVNTIALEAREIVQLLETYLLAELLDGKLSLTEIAGSRAENAAFAGIVEVIRDELGLRQAKCLEKAEAQRKLVKELDEALKEIETEYSKVWMFDPFNRRHTLFEEHKQALEDYLEAKTKSVGYDYAGALIPILISQIDTLNEQIGLMVASMNNLFVEFEEELKMRCTEGEDPDFAKLYVKYYSAPSVRRLTGRLRVDEILMGKQCGVLREKMKERLGFGTDRPSFKSFNNNLGKGALAGLMAEVCSEQSRIDHDAVLQNNEDRLFGVDLVARLLHSFRTPAQQAELARRLVPQATTLGGLNDTERQNGEANPDRASIIRRSVSVIGKGFGDDAQKDVTQLQNALRAALPNGAGDMCFVPNSANSNEVVLVSLTNMMPLRCVERVSFLRDQYSTLLESAGGKLDAMFLHTEGDGTNFPRLYALSSKEVRRFGCQLLLVGLGCGVIQQDGGLSWEETDVHGRKKRHEWGKDIATFLDELTPARFSALKAAVSTALPLFLQNGGTKPSEERKQQLITCVIEQMDQIVDDRTLSIQDKSEFEASYNRLTEQYGARR